MPAIFSTPNAVADAASSAESPNAASRLCSTRPAETPSIEAKPRARPPASVCPRNSVMSGPGVMISTQAASV